MNCEEGGRNAGGVWKSRIEMLESCEEGGMECWRGVEKQDRDAGGVWRSRIGTLEGRGKVG